MPETSQNLPIRRMTLYKHGVGFVERRGAVDGAEIQLVFRADEVNDALKSLLALDLKGGQVLGIHYETPADRDARLAESGIVLGVDHSLLDLLRGLRGWQVRLTIGSGAEEEHFTGRLLGVDIVEGGPVSRARVALLEPEGGSVVNLALGQLTRVELLEDRVVHDLRFFLDTSRTEESHRTVRVRLSPGLHDLAVSYLVPSPTWRVSYRLVAESTDTADGQLGGDLLLQGWGLFDNRLEEDLNEVAVTLVAGQPISFIYDLATSRIPARRVVEDEARVAAGPVEFDEMLPPPPPMAPAPAGMPAPVARMRAGKQMMAASETTRGMQAFAEAAPPAATGADLGELFQYEVTTPVTVKRGESALVPILSARLPYKRQLLYNGAKMPTHPVAALRFTNRTDLVLERGPVTVIENGDYRGEALVPFTKTGGEIYLAFAVELGIKISEARKNRTEVAGLRIAGGYIHLQQAYFTITTYTCENSLAQSRIVTIEHPVQADADLVETRAPDEQNADYYRWQVPCPPRGTAKFVVKQRTLSWRQDYILNQSYDQLRQYMKDRWLDETVLARLKSILDERQAIVDNQAEITRIQNERNEIYKRQGQIRQNMGTLDTEGEEGTLRKKLFNQLNSTEDRLAAIDARIAALTDDAAARQARIDEALRTLSAESPQRGP
ncbi:MAG TPA: hypothetical protein VKY74_17830 [Chloroflexia bacterium]|nr:hypothetical protein [Chloroflexia bacterium]